MLKRVRTAVTKGRWQLWLDDAKRTSGADKALAEAVAIASTVLNELEERGEIVIVRDGKQLTPFSKAKGSEKWKKRQRIRLERQYAEVRRTNVMTKML